MITPQQVNEQAAKFNCRIYRVINTHGVMVQMTEESESWLCLWNAGWHETEQAALSATYQHLKECEQMNIFSTALFPYLEGLMIKDKPVTMTISKVEDEKIVSQRGTEIKTTVHFKERDKALILNKTNAKRIATFFGGLTTDWIGKKVTLYAEEGNWGGEKGWAVRVSKVMPEQSAPKAKQNGRAAHEDDSVITAEQAELLALTNPGAFD